MSTISFSGIASGIDGDAIIKTMSETKRLANIPLENQVEDNKLESTALEGFNQLLLQLNGKLSGLMSLSGGSLTRSASSSNSESVVATANSTVAASSLTIDVHSLARTASVSFDDRFASNTAPIAPDISEPKTISITVGQGDDATTIDLEINNKTTIDQLAAKIVDKSDGKLLASTVNVGTTDEPAYLLMINGTAMGTAAGSIDIDTSALASQGLFQSSSLEQATDARFNVTGIGEVVRSTNQISQLIPGLSFELKQAGLGPTTISIGVDKEKTTNKMREIVEAINEVIRFSKENGKVERIESGENSINQYGSLAKTKVDDQAIEAIRSALFSSVASNESSKVQMYADLGITTSRDGTLAFDEEKFKKSLGDDPKAVNEIISKFADKISSVNGVIYKYTSHSGQINLAIKSNKSQNQSTQDRIDRVERAIADQEERLRLLFANLESTISKLNSQGDALTGMLAGLNN